MNVVVLIKQVPDTGMSLRVSEKILDKSGLKWVLSPYDEFALEEALKLKPLLNGKIFAMSLGPDRVKESLLSALAVGADEAFHLKTEKTLQDPLSVASLLKNKIQDLPSVSLILCGKLAADQNDFAIPQMVAHLLNFPFVTNINHLKYEDSIFQITRECGGGVEEVLKVQGPVVLSADKGLNQPRYPSLPGIMKAKNKPFHVIDVENFKEDIRLLSLSLPPAKEEPKILSGEADEQVKELIRYLKEKEKIL